MRRIDVAPQWLLRAFILFWVSNAHALMLTKDTVRESYNPSPSAPTWHDSVTLVNATDDTLSMEAIRFIVPQGKEAHLRIGYKVPYRNAGSTYGLVIRSNQPLDFIFDPNNRRILPRERIPITGFFMETCIECPTGGEFNPNAPQDTITAKLVFETNVSRDTLVVIGTISETSSGIRFQAPPASSPAKDGRKGSRQHHFFNGLGQTGSEDPSSTETPVMVKFRRKGEDRP